MASSGMFLRVQLPALALALVSCSHPAPTQAPGAAQAGGAVVATVNGVRLTDVDLLVKLKADSHQEELKPEYRKNVLDALIRDELILQRGLALGLDADPNYQGPVRKMEAQLAALKRHQMADLFYRHEIAAKIAVSDADVRKYFDTHKGRLGTELHVLQILRRARAAIEQAKQELDGGKSFEAVAQTGFAGLPPEQKPWDLGYLKWGQLPVEWREAVSALKPGGTSGILSGAKDRFWIIKLVEVRHVEPDFDAEKAALTETMKGEKITELRASTERALRDQASIVYAQ